jgi:hypothetical protein
MSLRIGSCRSGLLRSSLWFGKPHGILRDSVNQPPTQVVRFGRHHRIGPSVFWSASAGVLASRKLLSAPASVGVWKVGYDPTSCFSEPTPIQPWPNAAILLENQIDRIAQGGDCSAGSSAVARTLTEAACPSTSNHRA